jgi:hypothetical protein
MSNAELAELIEERFTPFAFTCECKGHDPECQVALEDPAVWGRYYTVTRIADYIRALGE